jgi:hypothetical protein
VARELKDEYEEKGLPNGGFMKEFIQDSSPIALMKLVHRQTGRRKPPIGANDAAVIVTWTIL